MERASKIARRWLAILCFAGLGVYAALFVMQRELMFPTHQANRTFWQSPQAAGLPDFREETLQTEDGTRVTLWYRAADENKPTILFFHGNLSLVSRQGRYYKIWAEKGYGVAALSYRGYGLSEGKPSEAGVYRDADAALGFMKRQGVAEKDIVLYGQSIGTGVAVEMATRIRARALVLLSPYTSMRDMADAVYPWLPGGRYLVRDPFDSVAKAPRIATPVLIMHGDADRLIPIAQARRLYDLFPGPKRLVVFNGGTHHLMPTAIRANALEEFLAEIAPQR